MISTLQEFVDQGEGVQEFFGVNGETLEEAIEATKGVFDAPLMSALDRYSPGVMYKSMDFAGLPTGAQRRLLENAIIFSGMFGLIRPDDLIPFYKLKMDASLPEIGKVSRYWKPFISPILNKTLEGHIVWNLLPGTHRDAWNDDHSYELMVTVKFFAESGGERKAVTHGTKPLRGQLVNYLVREMIESPDELYEWEHPAGYVYDPEASSTNEETKTTELVLVKKA